MSYLPDSERRFAQLVLKVGRQGSVWDRSWGDLQIDASKARKLLDWRPGVGTKSGLEQVGRWYREQRIPSASSLA